MTPPGFYDKDRNPIDRVHLAHLFAPGKALLTHTIVYVSRDGQYHIVKAGFRTDGASIPKVAWRIIGTPFGVSGWGSKHPSYLAAAVVHDMYCDRANSLSGGLRWDLRKEGDKLFAEMLEVLGVPAWKVKLMYPAVRSAGMAGQLRKTRANQRG